MYHGRAPFIGRLFAHLLIDGPNFHKLLTYISIIDLDITQYPTFHDLPHNVMYDSDVFQLDDNEDSEDENKLYITFPDEHIFSNGSEVKHIAEILIQVHIDISTKCPHQFTISQWQNQDIK